MEMLPKFGGRGKPKLRKRNPHKPIINDLDGSLQPNTGHVETMRLLQQARRLMQVAHVLDVIENGPQNKRHAEALRRAMHHHIDAVVLDVSKDAMKMTISCELFCLGFGMVMTSECHTYGWPTLEASASAV